jgi:hypothetical protein
VSRVIKPGTDYLVDTKGLSDVDRTISSSLSLSLSSSLFLSLLDQSNPQSHSWSQPLQLLTQRGLGARQQVGGRENTSARLPPPQAVFVGQHEIQKLVAERQHGYVSSEVLREVDASRHGGGDPRGDLQNELVDAEAVCHEVLDVRAANFVEVQAVARRGGSGILVARQGRRHRAGRARLTRALSASRCS